MNKYLALTLTPCDKNGLNALHLYFRLYFQISKKGDLDVFCLIVIIMV